MSKDSLRHGPAGALMICSSKNSKTCVWKCIIVASIQGWRYKFEFNLTGKYYSMHLANKNLKWLFIYICTIYLPTYVVPEDVFQSAFLCKHCVYWEGVWNVEQREVPDILSINGPICQGGEIKVDFCQALSSQIIKDIIGPVASELLWILV